MRDAPDRFVLRESKDATDLPSVLSAWDTDSRLSFCLIEKAIWDDRDLTLRNKLTTGTYWNISVQGRGYPRNAMDKAEVGRISAIEVIGLGDGQYDALKKSHKCKCAEISTHVSSPMLMDFERPPAPKPGLEVHKDALGRC